MECKYESGEDCLITTKKCVAYLIKEPDPYYFCPVFSEEFESIGTIIEDADD
jgi:hypothetical protein